MPIIRHFGIDRFYFKLDSGLMAMLFCIIGYYINKQYLFTSRIYLKIISYSIILYILSYFYTGNIANCVYIDGHVYILTGAIGFYLTILLSKKIANSFLILVGKKSLPIFALHGILLSIMTEFLKIPVGKHVSILCGFFYTICVIILLLGTLYIYNKIKTLITK